MLLLCGSIIGGCRRSSETQPPSDPGSGKSWFTDVTTRTGLNFAYDTGATGKLYFPEIMAAGVALFDYDRDGDLDLYLTNGNHELPMVTPSENIRNRLYRQEPDGRFVDVTAVSGLGDGGYGMGVALGDIDNDGDTDVFLSNYGLDRLYRNEGNGTFVDITDRAGVHIEGWSCSASFLDMDRDGYLDLYVTRYVEFDPGSPCSDGAGRPSYCGPTGPPPVTDVLLRNNGDGTFADVSAQAGIGATAAAGLGVVCADFDDDGWIDIYVANDGYANFLWLNQKNGTFRDDALILGVALDMNGHAEAGMGVTAADFDNDLDLDLFMTHLRQESNTLYRNLGRSRGFNDAGSESGLAVSSVPYTGFGTAGLDVELDGDLDIVVVNGRVLRGDPRPGVTLAPPWDRYAEPNLFYLNDGSGHFTALETEAAALRDPIEVSRGLAVGDLDGDGDLDIVITNLHSAARIYRNDAPRQGHWLGVRAIDPRLKRDALGATVDLVCGDLRQRRVISSAFSYLSASEPIAHFGMGPATQIDYVDIRWPDGFHERFTDVGIDRLVRLERGAGRPRP